MAESTDFSPRLRRLFEERVHTLDELVTLLLLRSDRERAWRIDDVVIELRGGDERATTALESLIARKLVSFSFQGAVKGDRTRRYAYAPNPPDLDVVVEELERAYRHARIEIVMLIAANAVARVRARALETFSRAIPAGPERKNDEDG
jgi:hypothetical protein